MSAEGELLEVRCEMERCIKRFYGLCGKCDVDNEGFAEDVNDAVSEATEGAVKFDDWIE